MRAALGVLADVFFVLVFVVIGRVNHHAGEGLAGVTGTGWPFLAGLAIGEVATRAWRRPAAVVPTGVGVWLATVVFGQLLRVVSGQGTEFAFIGVSAAFLGLFLLGWRVIAARVPAVRSRLASRNSGGTSRG
jgi:Protein of unknown function (DUF3054)